MSRPSSIRAGGVGPNVVVAVTIFSVVTVTILSVVIVVVIA
jgi:hypothetical protein